MAGTAASLLVMPSSLPAQVKVSLLQRAIPSSGEMLPVIGLGTSRVFNAASSAAEREPLEQVVATLVKLGAKMVDTAPAYGQAEAVTGEIAAKLKLHDKLFLATKVGTTGKAEGVQQMERSLELLGKKPLDLIQVHNLTDWETQLGTLQEWKKQGRIRYVGITTSRASAHADIARILKKSGSISSRSIIPSWNAKPRSAFSRSRKNAAWPCSSIAPSVAAICSGALAGNHCPNGRRKSIASHGLNSSSSGSSPIPP